MQKKLAITRNNSMTSEQHLILASKARDIKFNDCPLSNHVPSLWDKFSDTKIEPKFRAARESNTIVTGLCITWH